MNIRLTIIALLVITKTWAQVKDPDNNFSSHSKLIPNDQIVQFFDSLKTTVINDTSKFNRNDLVHTAIGTINNKGYSKLYIINGKYSYKLDIVPSKMVLEFLNEYFVPSRIQNLTVVDPFYSVSLYGSRGTSGTILIQLKKRTKFNPQVGGLIVKGISGNNFRQKQRGELLIRE
jgi:hypothetical protein